MTFSGQTYDQVKHYVLKNTVSSVCLNCGRHAAIRLPDPKETWSTDPNYELHFRPGTALQVICCDAKSFWSLWHDQWKRRKRNQARRLRQGKRAQGQGKRAQGQGKRAQKPKVRVGPTEATYKALMNTLRLEIGFWWDAVARNTGRGRG